MDIVSWAGASEHVRVYVRIRPPNERELASDAYTSNTAPTNSIFSITGSQGNNNQGSQGQSTPTVSVVQPNHVVISAGNKSDMFTYDCVGSEDITQERVFNDVGKSIVEQCVKGYNGTIFAYGQTGSGKTYTMQGPTNMTDIANHTERGIIPRCLEYLFSLIATEEEKISSVKYLCKASYIEIYNESIYDLLDNSTVARATREDIKRGVYVDGVVEESIHSPEDAYKLFELGAANRHISATSMNRESSRSHTVLTLTIQSMTLVDGINHIRESRFNLVDLAGSERQKLAHTEGMRLKEAGNINKSLLCLGSVINALGEIAGGHSRHVHYRDSKLTFLLKDSLGGNSNTFIVANVSPSALCYQESLSTLRFAQRAKMIKNKAVVNEDIQGNVNELRAEIQRLKAELALKRITDGTEDTSVMRMMFVETLAKLRVEQEEHLAMAQKGFMLDDACKAREKQIQSAQLIIKFKESALSSYRKGATSTALDSEKAAFQEEVTQLKKQLDFHPEVLKVKAENLSLREMLQKYEKYQSSLDEFEEGQKKDKEYLYNLAGRIITLEQETETLRAKLGCSTPRGQEAEEIDFPRIEGIEDIMQESPPKVRDADRRFSSDMKSLLQRVTKSRQAEYRRLSGNLVRPEEEIDIEKVNQRLSTQMLTPGRDRVERGTSEADDSMNVGVNLSDSFSAQSAMHSEDTVEVTLLKRDMDRLKDENSVLVDEKANLERELSDSQFQLMTMEKCLDQATNQAEQLGRELQESRQALGGMEQEAALKIMELTKEMQEQVDLMEKMRVASIHVEEETNRIKNNLRGVEQQLKVANHDLTSTRQRLLDNQKEYDHQVEYNRKRINEFQEKEARWEDIRAELVDAKQKLQAKLQEERTQTTSTRSELEQEHQRLLQDRERQEAEMTRLVEVRYALEAKLEEQKRTSGEAVEKYTALLEVKEKQEFEIKDHQVELQELESKLQSAKETIEEQKKRMELAIDELKTTQATSAKALESHKKQLEEQDTILKEQHAQALKEYESKDKVKAEEVEEAERTLRRTLEEAHGEGLRTLMTQVEAQSKSLEELEAALSQSREESEMALALRSKVEKELDTAKEAHEVLSRDYELLVLVRDRVKSDLNVMGVKVQSLELTLAEQKQEMSRMKLTLQQDQWEKGRLETTRAELREKVSEMARKIGETEQKLEQERDRNRSLEMEAMTTQDELEHQLDKIRGELAAKTRECVNNDEYKLKFRELRAQFADLGTHITERQEQGFHERELKRRMELERAREEMETLQTDIAQTRANLTLAQEANEQLMEEAKANTAKIAEEMTTRLRDFEEQRKCAEQEMEQALETIQQKTTEVQTLAEEAIHQKERVRALEEDLLEERTKAERLESTLNQKQEQLKEGQALLEEQEAAIEFDREKEAGVQEAKQKLKEEQLLAQRELLIKMKQEQQELFEQHVKRRDKTIALFEGLATENGKLMEQVRDLGLVNENILKHQNPKQKLQYHVKIKQENNALRIENQRLMFKAIELEERLGNKENVESLRKQVWEMHGESPFRTRLDIGTDSLEGTEVSMEMIKSLGDSLSAPRSSSASPGLSSEASTSPGPLQTNTRSTSESRPVSSGQKRKAPINNTSGKLASHSGASSGGFAASRKRFAGTGNEHGVAPSVSRQRIGSRGTSSTPSSAPSTEASTDDVPMGPRARAKAAADAALAAKSRLLSGTAASMARGTPTSRASPGVGAAFSRPTKAPVQRVSTTGASSTSSRVGTANQANILRGVRSGGAVVKPAGIGSASSLSAAAAAAAATKSSGSASVIGGASAQRAALREARLAAVAASEKTMSNKTKPDVKKPVSASRSVDESNKMETSS
ncbi:Kinesin-like protein kif15, partial [Lunasporangiospora selenospora]